MTINAGSPSSGAVDGQSDVIDPAYFFINRVAPTDPASAATSNTAPSAAPDRLPDVVTGSDGQSYIVIDATAMDGDGRSLLASLRALGLQQGSDWGPLVSGLFPVAQLGALADVANLVEARQSVASVASVDPSQLDPSHVSGDVSAATGATQGSVISQGDHAMATDAARGTYHVDGTGLIVGVLSDSFNYLGGQQTDINTGDLPSDTQVLQDYLQNGSADEGRAMAQIVHDVAPGAAIRFATAFTGIAGFANNITALANAGARVIVDDIFYYAEPTYQDSAISQAIDGVSASGVTYLTLAGNHRNGGYTGVFNASASTTTINGRAETLHQFAPGQTYIPVTVGAGASIRFSLQWDNPAASVSPGRGATADLDAFLYNGTGAYIGALATNNNTGGDPVETFTITNNASTATSYRIAVGLHAGNAPPEFRLMALGNGATVSFGAVSSNTSSATVYGHSGAAGAITVGADYYANTPAYNVSPPALETFSSLGPDRVTYDTAGNRLATASVRQAPTLTAPDGGDNTFFGSNRDATSPPNFSGTSAAGPHAAGLAALMLQANTALTPVDIRHLMQDSAIDQDNPYTTGFDTGYDAATGSGLVQGAAVGFAATGVIDNTARANPVLYGTHLADVIVSGAGAQTLTGYDGRDTYRDTAVNHTGDTVTDFAYADLIDVTNANLGFSSLSYASGLLSFTLTGAPQATTYTMTLQGGVTGTPLQRPDGSGGFDIYFASPLVTVPTVALAAASDTGVSSTDGITRLTTVTLTGSGTAGDGLTIYDDGNGNAIQDSNEATLASLTVPTNGTYATDITLTAGTHALRAYQSDGVLTSVSSNAAAIVVDTLAPTLSVLGVSGATNVVDGHVVSGTI
uniref:S8 family serine peptidase n=1 Tax=uncultured Methylobacterium sp. TaxID=157278 RepID=UPI0035CB22F4